MTSNSGPATDADIDTDTAAALMEPLTDLVAQAGAAILAIDRPGMTVKDKSDGSPVTAADLAADRIIADGLRRLAPRIPVLSEERVDPSSRPCGDRFFLVDPLDGTKEFVAGRDEFTVNIALVSHGTPLLGIIGAPALGVIWRGLVGRGAESLPVAREDGQRVARRIKTRPHPASGKPWVAAVSRSHGDPRTEAFIAGRPGAVRLPLGSAVKFGCIAEGRADIYPRLSPTSEWDVAAGHAVVTAAGGRITDGRGAPLRFGERRGDFLVPDFIAWGDPAAVRNS